MYIYIHIYTHIYIYIYIHIYIYIIVFIKKEVLFVKAFRYSLTTTYLHQNTATVIKFGNNVFYSFGFFIITEKEIPI